MASNYLIVFFAALMVSHSYGMEDKKNVKRSFGFPGGFGVAEWNAPNSFGGFGGPAPWNGAVKTFPPTPAEITNAISGAKQASANVLIAQQQVQAEKENVLQQQKIANEKENLAHIAKQKNDVFSAVQRSEAAAAAQAVVLAQQRLAAAKAAVAEQQRLAAHREASAAIAIQSAAHAAAAEIHRTENLATRLSNLQRNDNAALTHHVAATKDSLIAPLGHGLNHSPNYGQLLFPSTSQFAGGIGGGHQSSPWANVDWNLPNTGNFYFPQKPMYNPWN